MMRALSLCSALLGAWGAAGAAGFDYALHAEQVAAGVYVFRGVDEHFSFANGGNIVNTGFIVTEAGVLVIDTGPSRLYAQQMRAEIERITRHPVTHVYVTHHHPDHFLGNQVFADVPVYALHESIAAMRAEGEAFSGNMYRLVGAAMRGTELSFPSEEVLPATLRLGERPVRLIGSAGHTAADLAVFDERSGVLFAGDLVFNGRAPTTPHADLGAWAEALDELAALPIQVLVPGHGAVVRGSAPIGETRDYLRWLDLTLRDAAERGLDMNEVMAIELPPRFAALAVQPEEFRRSVSHLYPGYEARALPRVARPR